jgi:predicted permease
VIPLYEQVTGASFRLALWTLFGAVGLVLLIACANAAHLILARGLDRGGEFALRQALGASTPRLIRQALTENLALSVLAGIAGLLLATGGLRLLVALAPAGLPRLHEIGVDAPVLIYGAVVTLVAGVLFGAAPALRFSRTGIFGVLRSGEPAGHGGGQHARRLLIVFQVALAIVVMFGANLLIRSLQQTGDVDPGFAPEGVLMANLSIAPSDTRATFHTEMLREVQAIPGVLAAGIIEDLFISGAPNGEITIEGRAADATRFEAIRSDAIAGEFFRSIGVTLLAGREFSGSDDAEAPPVAIINETMARRFWPGESPLHRRFRPGGEDSDAVWIEVVGLVGDMHRQGLEAVPIAQVFRPWSQSPSRSMNLLVKSDGRESELAATVRSRIAAIDGTVPLYRVTTVAQTLDGYLSQRRFQTFLLGLFSAIALTLAAVGIYGLIQHSVARRTHELGVRIALGARPGGLVLKIVREGLLLATVGVAAGMACALWLSDAVSGLLFGVPASDPVSIVVTSVVLLLTALVACYVPARRVLRIDPALSLRQE